LYSGFLPNSEKESKPFFHSKNFTEMFTKHTIALVALTLFTSIASHAITWTGALNSAWGNQHNWDENRVPNANDDVVIPNTANNPVIFFGANVKSVYLESGARLTLLPAQKLTVKGGGAFGIKNYGEFFNSGVITIGAEDVVSGIENYGYFLNKNTTVINRATQCGIYNYDEGTFDNEGDLNIATYSVLDGIINFGTFDIDSGSELVLDNILRYGIDNQAPGEFNNSGNITFPGNGHVNNGLNNASVFNNESTGELHFEQGGLDGIVNYLNSTVNNRGKIKIGTVGSYTDGIANIGGTFNNFENGEIHIDRTENVAIGQSAGTFLNEGKIVIGAAASVGTYGILNGMFAGFENKPDGEISINNTSNAGIYAFGMFENEGSVVIESATGGHAFEGALQNAGCASMLVSNALNIYFNNEGYLWVDTDKAHSIIGNNPAINNGIIVYPQGNPIPNVTNNDLMILPIAGECSIANALQIGAQNDFLPSATWYKDINFTQSAGSYHVATNTFQADGLAEGTHTLFIGVVPLAGLCWYPAPITVTYDDVTKPSIFCPANTTVAANENCSGTVGAWSPVSAGDNCTANPAVTQSPAANTPMSGHNDVETIILTANDGNGNTQSCSFTVTLKDVSKPTIVCPTNKTVNAGSNCSGIVGAWSPVSLSDNCTLSGSITVTQSPSANTALSGHNDVETVTLTANDGNGNTQNCQFTVTLKDVTQPVFTSVPANVTVQCNAVPTVGTASASDNCSVASVTYIGQTISNTTCTDTYVITRQWTAADAAGNTRTATQRITVQDTQKPNFVSTPANLTVQCDAVPEPTSPAATDNCDASVAVTYNGQTTTSGACPNAYTITRRWTAADNCGNTKTITQRISVVDNIKPVFTSFPQNATIACNDNPPAVGNPTASDGCGSATVTYLGQSTTSGSCPGNYQIKRSWRATDACGNSTVATQTIQVVDNDAPVFVIVPGSVTIECGQSLPPLANPTASDACGYAFVTFIGQEANGSGCAANYTVTRTWETEDLCGNSATISQVITVLGNGSYQEEGAENRTESITESITHRSSLIAVFPNPTTDRVWIDLSGFENEATTISIFSDYGQLIWEKHLDTVDEQRISVSLREAGAAAGIYTVRVQSGNTTAAKRLVLAE